MSPEAKARQQIDQKLEQAGWVIQDMKQISLDAAAGRSTRKSHRYRSDGLRAVLQPQQAQGGSGTLDHATRSVIIGLFFLGNLG
jgi:hypothetical protein